MRNPKLNDFECLNCHKKIKTSAVVIANRNHCPYCLASKHVDQDIPGDRKSLCQKSMQPIGLTFKQVGLDKWGKEKQGELMLIHECNQCGKISINRIAGDDDPSKILEVLAISHDLNQDIKDTLEQSGIRLLINTDLTEIKTQLFGNKLV